MNKYQEVLNSIDEKTTETIDYCLGPAAILRYCGDEVDILQELVDKATPKKPIKNKLGKISFLDKLFGIEATYTCPNCRNALLKHYMNERQETRYCWDCGQALDWRVEDGKTMHN